MQFEAIELVSVILPLENIYTASDPIKDLDFRDLT